MDAHESENLMLALHEMPPASTMTEAQRLGECCLWCDAPAATVEGGVQDLTDGRHSDFWRPRTCGPCRATRLRQLATHAECRVHTDECEGCIDTMCPDGAALLMAHAVARERAGKPVVVVCFHCHEPSPLTDLAIRPCLWDGDSAAHYGYVHVTPCPSAVPAWLRLATDIIEVMGAAETLTAAADLTRRTEGDEDS